MEGARSLISVFHQLNSSKTRTVAHFSPSLIGMFGSIGLFTEFLTDIDAALVSGSVPPSLKKRAANLSGTFIPQVAGFNGIADPAACPVTAAALRNINCETLESRREGVVLILSALMFILAETVRNSEQ